MGELYIGIDLGTTSSAIAWGGTSTVPNIIEIDRPIDRIRRIEQRALLPSCTYFSPTMRVVGEYAKHMIREEPWHVAKSMKCYMDEGNKPFGYSSVSWTPIGVSTCILKHLKDGANKDRKFDLVGGLPKKVVITVPASFKEEMPDATNATLEAAVGAGFERRNVKLLVEPHAVLYYFCSTPLPNDVDFIHPKQVLVFDLGGGTLDVSLHKVSESKEKGLRIEDIAWSPYTRFGGDNFDEKVGDQLLKEYIEENALEDLVHSLVSTEKDLLRFQFQAYAEEAKIQWGNYYAELRKDPSHPHLIKEEPILQRFPNLPHFHHELTWTSYKCIIEPFLGTSLTLDSEYDSSAHENIINPILNVLDSAKQEMKLSDRPEVNIVLLNGGMTKLPLIQERLEKFFGSKVVRPNVDKAVALGAVIYQKITSTV